MQQLTNGTLLQGGKYKIERVLGQGGFGITYLAEQVMLGRKVAIKEFFMKEYCNRDKTTGNVTLGSEGSRDAVYRFREKFMKEARLIASMDNQHIVRIFDAFEENGTAYYVMEHLDSICMNDMLAHVSFSEDTALKFTHQIADALAYIHEMNVLHLDVKPANILLRKNGDAVLIDFGISKRYDNDGGQTSTTPTGISKGYAPLEQYNQGMQNFTPCTDIYSLGATMYKMITANTPPEAAIVNEDGLPEKPSTITETTWNAIVKAMCPRRKERPQSIGDFLHLLDVNVTAPVECATNEETVIVENNDAAMKDTYDIPSPILQQENAFCEKYGVDLNETLVDLGLSVLWSSHNVGAANPVSAGIFSSWTDWQPSKKNGELRLPSSEELKELKDNCSWKWIDEGEICGYLVTSPSTGNKIFLRASGKIEECDAVNTNIGFYWSNSGSALNGNAYSMTFMPGTVLCYIQSLCRIRMSMRQVCEKS